MHVVPPPPAGAKKLQRKSHSAAPVPSHGSFSFLSDLGLSASPCRGRESCRNPFVCSLARSSLCLSLSILFAYLDDETETGPSSRVTSPALPSPAISHVLTLPTAAATQPSGEEWTAHWHCRPSRSIIYATNAIAGRDPDHHHQPDRVRASVHACTVAGRRRACWVSACAEASKWAGQLSDAPIRVARHHGQHYCRARALNSPCTYVPMYARASSRSIHAHLVRVNVQVLCGSTEISSS